MASRICVADPKGPCNAVNLRFMQEYITELGGGIPEAPKDGKTYGRKDGNWVEITGSTSTDPIFQIPEKFPYNGTQVYSVSKPIKGISEVRVYDVDNVLELLSEDQYSVSGSSVTIINPTLSAGFSVKIYYFA